MNEVKRQNPSETRLRSAAIALIAVVVTSGTWVVGWLPAMERATGDIILRASNAGRGDREQVVAVLIDDRAVDLYGELPWHRGILADLISELKESGAHGMVIDLLLGSPSQDEADVSLSSALEDIPKVLAAAFDRNGRWILPPEAFGGAFEAAHAYGEVGPDGVVRSFAATKQSHGLSLPALSLAAARFRRPELVIEIGGEIRPDFRPAPQDLPVVSAAAVLDGSYDPALIADRIVFVGIAATGAGDQFVVPTGPRHQPVPGVLAHASACVSILRGRLLRVPPLAWSIVAAFVIAYGIQWIRDRRGIFDFGAFAVVAIGVAAIAYLSVRYGLLLIPVTSLLASAVVSALLRETSESWIARRESGRLLSAVLDHVGASPSTVPATAAGRLDALYRLQDRILEEDATRKALLDQMNEGVVVWDEHGEAVLVNPAARRLWSGEPKYAEILAGRSATEPFTVGRGSREIAVGITDLGRGHLAILRDVTAERALERRRREMQRLVSHELKTPLSSIAGFGESLERYELDGDEQRRVARLIRNEAQRLQEMVTAFLDLERLGGGHWEGAAKTVDLGHHVDSRLNVLESAARRKKITIRRSISDNCRTRVVPDLLDRVVDNLVGNAIKYSEEGETIEIEVLRADDEVELTVRDHGPGIADDQQERIFDRFFRIPGSSSTGAGLGLALAREVVGWHGGCITIDSEIGVGSAFSVRLPAVREE